MKKIVGLDIGTNSIGWSVISHDIETHTGTIDGIGSRIIPMDGDTMGKFESGTPVSKAAIRRQARGARRLLQRYKIRRSRLVKALQLLGWVPSDFPADFRQAEKFNINYYMPFSAETLAEAKLAYDSDIISNDWIIYFLRTKALTQKITLTELARILYHFNQRRGFKSRREAKQAENETDDIKYPLTEKFVSIVKILNVVETGEEKGLKIYEITCKNESLQFTAIKKRKTPPDWLHKEMEFEITKKTTKAQEVTYTITEPDRNDWEKMKIAHEKDLVSSGLTVGQYYFQHLRDDKNYRVKQRIIDRSFYISEFEQIWCKQVNFYPELNSNSHLPLIAAAFYKHNKEKQKELEQNDLKHLFMNDIIYYQRNLRSQKHLIAECSYETKSFIDPVNGKPQGIKVCPKSAPVFQEFRIWQTIHNIRLIKKEEIINGKIKVDIDVTDEYLDTETKAKLYNLFDSRQEVSPDSILTLLGFKKSKINGFTHKLNYPDDKDFKGNETKALFRKIFKKHNYTEQGELLLNNSEKMELLWNIIYSLTEVNYIKKALTNKKHFDIPHEVIDHLANLPAFPSQYASFSAKAIKKLLPLMRCGQYWDEAKIDTSTVQLIDKILNGELDENINIKTRDEIQKRGFNSKADFQGLPVYLAGYVVYGRHSERTNEDKYSSPDDIKVMDLLANNSLRNPIVEQIIRETLQVVKAIWTKYGQPDEIHIELGRELKKNNKEREEATLANSKNKVEKERIAALLSELKSGNPQSPMDIERFQVWKGNGGNEGREEFDMLFKTNRADFIPNSDIERYKLWAESGCCSPYTGQAIPLSELFTAKYEIEHIIPKSRFFDDSMGNKTICEAEVNKLKDNRLGMQFIEEMGGKTIETGFGKKITLFTVEEYNRHIDATFFQKKKRYFKLSEVPEEFISRQLNDTRYISRTIAELLYPVAKDANGIVYTNGAITSELKTKWGLHKKWKALLKPRFERLEQILNSSRKEDEEKIVLIDFNNETKDFHFAKDYKRIDHRHHALDALVIACTSRAHIKYLNTLNAVNHDKKEWEKFHYLLNKQKQLQGKETGMREFEKPWATFTTDAFTGLQGIIVSHKNNSRLVSKTVNYYKKYIETEPGRFELKYQKQLPPADTDKTLTAVRKLMFAQPLGQVNLAVYTKGVDLARALKAQVAFIKKHGHVWNSKYERIAISKIRKQIDALLARCGYDEKVALKWLKENPLKDETGNDLTKLDLLKFEPFTAKRVPIDASFTKEKIEKLPYASQPNNPLPKLLRSHLQENNNDPKIAFTGEGLESLYKKAPYPINKVTRTEGGDKIAVGNKLFEGAKGTNMYFVIKENMETGERTFYTPGLMDCIERLAAGLPVADEEPGYRNIILSPNDLVYVPDCDGDGKVIENVRNIDWENEKQNISTKIYKLISFSDYQAFFIPHNISAPIIITSELGSNNKSERSWNGNMIKKVCFKIQLDRLGNVKTL
jgi:CRISPR-associated endonuclease Csn1